MSIGPRNPYIAGNPVGDSAAFVGRTDVLRAVLRVLRHEEQNAIVLYGQRRIGKTSVLQHLKTHLPKEGPYRPVYFDLQDKAALPLDQVLRDLANAIAQALGQPAPNLGSDAPATFRDRWLPGVLDALPEGCSVVLLLDEFDVLAGAAAEQAAKALFPYLREMLAADPARLKFDFVIGRNIDDLDNIALSVFKGTPARRISLLSQEDCAALARLSEANGTLHWPEDALGRVWELANGHPFLSQSLCSHVWERAYDRGPDRAPTVTVADVDAAVPEALDASRNTMEWLWAGLPPAERVVAAALAEAGATALAPEALERLLRDAGVRVVIRELQSAPALLQDWDLIEPTDGGYRFRVELLRRWIAENKPLRRVQEELDYVEPVAENLYQAAMGLFQAGQLEGSTDVLRRAVALNPNHVRANQLLADNLLAQGNTDEAIGLLERLFQYQPAAARPRLVQALLARAQSAAAPQTALGDYERVLAADPAHPEAMAGKRRIWQDIGDSAREAGKLDAALKAYETAGNADLIRAVRDEMRHRNLAAELQMLHTAEQGGAFRQALELARTLAERYPDERDWTADLERLERRSRLEELYRSALEAMRAGDRPLAQRLLVQVVSIAPDYEQATRYLHEAVHGAEPGPRPPEGEGAAAPEAKPPQKAGAGTPPQPEFKPGTLRVFGALPEEKVAAPPAGQAPASTAGTSRIGPVPDTLPGEPGTRASWPQWVWWLIAWPDRFNAHREAVGTDGERRLGAWLTSTLIWLPLLLLFAILGIQAQAHIPPKYYSSTVPVVGTGLCVLAWIVVAVLGSLRRKDDRIKRWPGWVAGGVTTIVVGLAVGWACVYMAWPLRLDDRYAIPITMVAIAGGGGLGVAGVMARGVVQGAAGGALLGTVLAGLIYGASSGKPLGILCLAGGLVGLGVAIALRLGLRKSLETGRRSALVFGALLVVAVAYVKLLVG